MDSGVSRYTTLSLMEARASEAEVVVIVMTYKAPTRTRVGQDCGALYRPLSARARALQARNA